MLRTLPLPYFCAHEDESTFGPIYFKETSVHQKRHTCPDSYTHMYTSTETYNSLAHIHTCKETYNSVAPALQRLLRYQRNVCIRRDMYISKETNNRVIYTSKETYNTDYGQSRPVCLNTHTHKHTHTHTFSTSRPGAIGFVA